MPELKMHESDFILFISLTVLYSHWFCIEKIIQNALFKGTLSKDRMLSFTWIRIFQIYWYSHTFPCFDISKEKSGILDLFTSSYLKLRNYFPTFSQLFGSFLFSTDISWIFWYF